MDRLIELIKEKGNPTVVGLDPRPELIPGQLIDQARDGTRQSLAAAGIPDDDAGSRDDQVQAIWAHHLARAYLEFNLAVIAGVSDLVPAVKPQIAMYEALGLSGVEAYTGTCRAAADRGLYVIGDIKRGDIGSTASAYAAHLSGLPLTWEEARREGGGRWQGRTRSMQGHGFPWYEDAITVNPYLGSDGLDPFIQAAQEADGDLFVLVHTSNPSSKQIQELQVSGDSTDGGMLFEHLAGMVEDWGAASRGGYGYSRLGAVVGATHPQAGSTLRRAMPHTFFLVPGYGAQGGSARDVVPMFDAEGRGAIVNSSRGIIAAWRKDQAYTPALSLPAALRLVTDAARRATQAMKDDLNQALKENR